MHILCWFYY